MVISHKLAWQGWTRKKDKIDLLVIVVFDAVSKRCHEKFITCLCKKRVRNEQYKAREAFWVKLTFLVIKIKTLNRNAVVRSL